ncbi:MAG: MarR family transcriptional regulator [Candidatus Krumholzibacteria bacterium]|jgi:DNA-binding MarR family transcriptional regulator|nr:MarR family transcriptional regulator [Candidatus Krumholzibacteria bacterium]
MANPGETRPCPEVGHTLTTTEFTSERRVLIAIRRLIRAVDIYSRSLVAQHQITGPQLLCLNQLAEAGSLTVTELAAQVQLSASTVVRILDRLEAKNLIRRERSADDRRRVIVSLTPAGRQFSLLTPYSERHPLRRAMQQLAAGERDRLAALLETLVDIIAAPPLSAAPVPPLDTLLASEPQQE